MMAEGISSTLDILRGEPCIAGTRIPTRAVREFAKDGYSVTEIIAEYPTLTAVQIANALAWEMRPRRDRAAALRARTTGKEQ